ncbi:MAG: hypothetical protein AAF402_00240 [Pseudomonadota bacterium]
MTQTLLAVLSADVVGFSGMMSREVTNTIEKLKRPGMDIPEPAFAAKREHIDKSNVDRWTTTFQLTQGRP